MYICTVYSSKPKNQNYDKYNYNLGLELVINTFEIL